ncbi:MULTISPECIES: DNA-processing protein DprA [Francisella]|uniref:DNA-protecting protein DprA n=1 Tax=Francisella opportunistica TaxID=2016517 RepID=A0A345JST7_9GAMM|nr:MULTISPECIES: DNA-processing protein DprA [Francisella]APC92161.1 Rossmann fold nucleotide-binding protein Smf [Francisella sp. MA067296]AXH30383.1 DNA-protecting protein DprA [Francisella opportunistica]AXH32024.1 DNA protecting protein DprA [Francisella opportunistica]AXH33671.1 DNA protecting protein DprA [Francisella opportunistica]
MIDNTTKSLIALSITPYFGNIRFLKARENNFDFNEVVSSPSKYIKSLSLRQESLDFLNEKKYLTYLDKVSKWLDKNNKNHIISYLDIRYPLNLKQIVNSPLILYCSGNIDLLNSQQLAIVGARNHSSYGKNVTARLCTELKGSQISITSGLAYGIDTLAHKYAIDNNLNTIAVVGTGIDVIYPSANRELYNKIINSNGLVISEFPLGTGALRYNFPQRNRIISGLSKGVVVVEAASKSGSLITAELALEQNKEVFAIPGSIFSTTSQGCNELIKQGAKLVCNINDILEEINITSSAAQTPISNTQDNKTFNLSESEKIILNTINKELTTIDKIIMQSKLPYNQITSILFELELKSLIETIPGGYIKL